VRLTSLTLLGFKSFAEKTRLEFMPGVNAIVGPNGSGKSNIVEALRWATGGGRAAAYRAEERSELIFHGSTERRGVSFAEVTLSLENARERLHVSRSLYRDGQTKLTLNGRAARLIDVDEALAGSGLGRGSLAVIGQGEVGQVLVADPPRLLGYVEEAAGVTKLSGRRERTQSSLEAAREHLERLDDLIEELRQQFERLSEEAAQAERARTLGGRELRLRYTLSRRRAEALEGEVSALALEGEALREALQRGGVALEAAQATWQRARAWAAEAEGRYRQVLTEAEARRGDLRVAEERVAGLRERSSSLAREAAAIGDERRALEAVAPPPRPEFSLEDLHEQARQAEKEFARHETQAKSLGTELGQREKELVEHEQALSAYRARRGELEREADEVEGRLAELEGKEGQDELAALEEAHSTQEAHAKVLRSELETLRQELAALQGEHATAHGRAQALSQAASRARAAFEARRGYAEGPRQALTLGIPGVVGAVADLIWAPQAYALALSSALGRRAENVVVDSAETAQRVIERLKRSGGRATLLPLDLIEDRKLAHHPALEVEEGFIGMLPDLVEFEDRYGAVVRQLLGAVALVRTLEGGVALARRHKHRPRLVTLEGETIESYGALSGGRAQSGALQLINLRGEVESGERERDEARARSDALGRRVKEAQERFKDRGGQLEKAQGELQETGQRVAAARAAEAARVSLLGELVSRRERVRASLAALSVPRYPVEDGKGEVARLRSELERVGGSAGEWRRRHAQARERLAAFEERWRGYEEAERRFNEAQRRLGELRQRQASLEEESQAAGERLAAALWAREAAQAALPTDLEEQHKAYEEARRSSQEAEARLTELSQAQAARNAELEALGLSLARREASLELAREEAAGFPAGLEPVEGSLKTLRAELGEVQDELGGMGPVNYRAALEKEAQEARLAELTAQAEEAREAMGELEGVLTSLDEEVMARLDGAIAEVKARFSLYCRQLFGGGEADIAELREEGRTSGLRITLQPPGKRTRSLNLLSVGERTMGALAFLFALIAKGNGSGLSVAILDEVDAPLDEANIRRFCSFLASLARDDTQFVLVTHQKATMEVADALWGVTTERGVSRIFSISKAHAVP
jgi:chromosome segregation protein